MPLTEWRLKGDWIKNCNCAFGCPCDFNARPTNGNCTGLVGMHIADGHFGEPVVELEPTVLDAPRHRARRRLVVSVLFGPASKGIQPRQAVSGPRITDELQTVADLVKQALGIMERT